jgi:type I restriction enzyme M protein
VPVASDLVGRRALAEAGEAEDEDEPFEEKMWRLTSELGAQLREAEELSESIRAGLEGIGYAV